MVFMLLTWGSALLHPRLNDATPSEFGSSCDKIDFLNITLSNKYSPDKCSLILPLRHLTARIVYAILADQCSNCINKTGMIDRNLEVKKYARKIQLR